MKKYIYFADNGLNCVCFTPACEDDAYIYGDFNHCSSDVIPNGIEDVKRNKPSSGRPDYEGKFRKDDPLLLERFIFHPPKKGIYKNLVVRIQEDMGHRFFRITITVPSPEPIGNLLLAQKFYYNDNYGKEGFWEGYIPCNDPELVLDPNEAVKTESLLSI